MFALAEKHFGAIPARALPARKPQDEPPQLGMKRVTVKAPAELPYVLMTFRAPALRDPERDWEPYALEMLAAVLDGNEAARLNRNLVRERAAGELGGRELRRHRARARTFSTSARRRRRARARAEVEQGLRREMAKIIDEGVTEEELNRVKAQAIAARSTSAIRCSSRRA